jgi:DNA-binding CsgD family transcriptional regulator
LKKSDLEAAFDFHWRALAPDLPKPEPEHYFAKPRKWRVDRAWPEHKVAVEIEGGTWGRKVICHNCGSVVRAKKAGGRVGREIRSYGGHNAAGFKKDIEKYNRLSALGWILLRYSNEDIHGDPHSMVKQIRGALEMRSYQVADIAALSKRQEKVLYLVAAGFKTGEISKRMNTTETAIRRSVQRTCDRLVVNNRAAAVARAIAWGLIDLEKIPWSGPAADLISAP